MARRIIFNDEDVREGSLRILHAMHNIRQEVIQETSISTKVAYEYSNLRTRLAGGLETLRKIPLFEKNLSVLIDELNKEPALISYDPLQYEYWRRKCPKFCNSLSNLLILFMQEQYCGQDLSHHIFQSVKYLLADAGEALDATPLTGGIDKDLQNLPDFRYQDYHFTRISPFTSRIDRLPEDGHLLDMERYASTIGYNYLLTSIPPFEISRFTKVHPDYKVVEKEDINVNFRKKICSTDVAVIPALIDIYAKNKNPNIHTFLHLLAQEYSQTHTALNWFKSTCDEYAIGLVKHYRGLTDIQVFARVKDTVHYSLLLIRKIKDRKVNLETFFSGCAEGKSPPEILSDSFASDPVYVSFSVYKGNNKTVDMFATPGMEER